MVKIKENVTLKPYEKVIEDITSINTNEKMSVQEKLYAKQAYFDVVVKELYSIINEQTSIIKKLGNSKRTYYVSYALYKQGASLKEPIALGLLKHTGNSLDDAVKKLEKENAPDFVYVTHVYCE